MRQIVQAFRISVGKIIEVFAGSRSPQINSSIITIFGWTVTYSTGGTDSAEVGAPEAVEGW